jgi:single-strand DNA-binding protein
MELKNAKITKILEKVTGEKKDGSGQWVKQSFVVETSEQYNNLYCFELFGDEKVDKFNQYNKVGSVVDVDFNVSTNEWQGKYFTTLQAWKIFKSDSDGHTETPKPAPPFEPANDLNEDDRDDLPF